MKGFLEAFRDAPLMEFLKALCGSILEAFPKGFLKAFLKGFLKKNRRMHSLRDS